MGGRVQTIEYENAGQSQRKTQFGYSTGPTLFFGTLLAVDYPPEYEQYDRSSRDDTRIRLTTRRKKNDAATGNHGVGNAEAVAPQTTRASNECRGEEVEPKHRR